MEESSSSKSLGLRLASATVLPVSSASKLIYDTRDWLPFNDNNCVQVVMKFKILNEHEIGLYPGCTCYLVYIDGKHWGEIPRSPPPNPPRTEFCKDHQYLFHDVYETVSFQFLASLGSISRVEVFVRQGASKQTPLDSCSVDAPHGSVSFHVPKFDQLVAESCGHKLLGGRKFRGRPAPDLSIRDPRKIDRWNVQPLKTFSSDCPMSQVIDAMLEGTGETHHNWALFSSTNEYLSPQNLLGRTDLRRLIRDLVSEETDKGRWVNATIYDDDGVSYIPYLRKRDPSKIMVRVGLGPGTSWGQWIEMDPASPDSALSQLRTLYPNHLSDCQLEIPSDLADGSAVIIKPSNPDPLMKIVISDLDLNDRDRAVHVKQSATLSEAIKANEVIVAVRAKGPLDVLGDGHQAIPSSMVFSDTGCTWAKGVEVDLLEDQGPCYESHGGDYDNTLWIGRVTQGANPMQVFVKTLEGRTITLVIAPDHSIEFMKFLVFKQTRIPMYLPRLVYSGKQLDDSRTLSDYNIRPAATIHLALRLRGSDIRLKQDIQRIGQTPGGIPLYSFRYIADPFHAHRGVMAQELIQLGRADAVSLDRNGFLQVDYSKLNL